jgi:hypothetical protein
VRQRFGKKKSCFYAEGAGVMILKSCLTSTSISWISMSMTG